MVFLCALRLLRAAVKTKIGTKKTSISLIKLDPWEYP